jgi:hypothetical protein
MKRDYIDSFQSILTRLANKDFDKHKNLRLTELLEDVNWKSDEFVFWFVTNNKFDNQSMAAITNEIPIPDSLSTAYDLDSSRVTYNYFDQEKIYDALTNRNNGDEKQGVDQVEIWSSKLSGKGRTEIIEIQENNYKSALLVIDSEQIAVIWRKTEVKNKLFDYNIRNYLGENKKNKDILNTAQKTPEQFFLFNNGISAICEKLEIDHKENKIYAERFSVINGAQTVRTLSKLANQNQPKVMFRVTEIPNHKDRNKFLKEVVRFNNTQNEIKGADFRSNDNIQLSIKNHFSDLILKGGKKYEYFPKRVDSIKKDVVKVEMPIFARAIFCYLFSPYELAGQGTTILFDPKKPDPTNSYYEQIFGPEDGSIPKEDFLWRAGVYFVWVTLEKWISLEKSKLKDEKDEERVQLTLNSLERKNIFMGFARKLFQRLENEMPDRFNEKRFLTSLAQSRVAPNITDDKDERLIFLSKSFDVLKVFTIDEYTRHTDSSGSTVKSVSV